MPSYIVWIIAIVLGAIVWGLIKQGYNRLMSGGETEVSAKTGEAVPRYLKFFKKVPLTLPSDARALVQGIDLEAKGKELTDLFKQAIASAKQFSWFPKIEQEHILFYFPEYGNLRFTVDIDGAEASVGPGFDQGREPSLVVPMHHKNLVNLTDILRDGKLSYEEQYRVYAVVAMSALQAIYRSDGMYIGNDLRPLKFDNLVHIDIPPTEPVLLLGQPVHIQVTAANVDGYWILAPGFQGDPDFKVSLNLEQATELYRLGVYETRKVGHDKIKALELSKKFLALLRQVKVYTRADHQQDK